MELWKKLGQSIVGHSAGDWSGYSVSLSSDGETLAIGSPGNHTFPSDDGAGYTKVYQRSSDNNWELEQYIFGEAKGDRLGHSVSLSGDGKTLAVGAPGHWTRNDRSGYVKVYHRAGYWKQLGQVIKGEALGNQFGQSVSLSADGKTLAVGANANDNENGQYSGHVRVFSLDGNGDDNGSIWNQIGQDINGEETADFSGYSVYLSSNGRTVAIGAPMNDGNGDKAGHVRVYQMNEDGLSWHKLGEDIDGEVLGDMSGSSVSLSANGKIVAIGAASNDGNGDDAGHVRVYHMDDSSSSWKQLGQDIDGEAARNGSGISLSLSDDGKTLAQHAFPGYILGKSKVH